MLKLSTGCVVIYNREKDALKRSESFLPKMDTESRQSNVLLLPIDSKGSLGKMVRCRYLHFQLCMCKVKQEESHLQDHMKFDICYLNQ